MKLLQSTLVAASLLAALTSAVAAPAAIQLTDAQLARVTAGYSSSRGYVEKTSLTFTQVNNSGIASSDNTSSGAGHTTVNYFLCGAATISC